MISKKMLLSGLSVIFISVVGSSIGTFAYINTLSQNVKYNLNKNLLVKFTSNNFSYLDNINEKYLQSFISFNSLISINPYFERIRKDAIKQIIINEQKNDPSSISPIIQIFNVNPIVDNVYQNYTFSFINQKNNQSNYSYNILAFDSDKDNFIKSNNIDINYLKPLIYFEIKKDNLILPLSIKNNEYQISLDKNYLNDYIFNFSSPISNNHKIKLIDFDQKTEIQQSNINNYLQNKTHLKMQIQVSNDLNFTNYAYIFLNITIN